ncbi:MAG: metallophosphoesterase [Campylobacteraceae bacterium]|nr:metallophosphoesterase [Campylobacteraceae bacterium]
MLFLCGDTHGTFEIDKILNDEFLNSYPFTRDDVLVVLGDFGVFWFDEPDENELYLLDIFEKLPFTLCFIDGNHENFNRLDKFETINKFGGKVGKAGENCYWLKRGEIYEICGKKLFTFGGAFSIDRVYRVLNKSWWLREIPSQAEMDYALENLKNSPDIDIVLTHTAPDFIVKSMGFFGVVDETTLFLEKVFYKIEPKEWYFGHFHLDKKLSYQNCKFRVLYNEIIRLS